MRDIYLLVLPSVTLLGVDDKAILHKVNINLSSIRNNGLRESFFPDDFERL
jgi:hypothetical protein